MVHLHSETKILTLRFYANSRGKEPVRDWLLGLDREDCRIIGYDIKTIECGWPLGMPLCKSLGHGLYEVRSNLKSDKIARIIFCIKKSDMVILHGFIKKSQKTPLQEIELALKRKKEIE